MDNQTQQPVEQELDSIRTTNTPLLPLQTTPKMTLGMCVALAISLITTIPPWLYLLAFSTMALDGGDSKMIFIPLLSFLIPLSIIKLGIFLAKKRNNFLWFFLPHYIFFIINFLLNILLNIRNYTDYFIWLLHA